MPDRGAGYPPSHGVIEAERIPWQDREPWRRMDAEAQDGFLEGLHMEQQERLELGEERYESHIYGFQGHPLSTEPRKRYWT